MYALTLHRPWAAAILCDTKRTENRSWAPKRLPGRIALHAGGVLDKGAAQLLADRHHLPNAQALPPVAFDRGIVGSAVVVHTHPASQCPEGPSCRVWGTSTGWHWVLDDVRALPRPVPATGRQRLWHLAEDQASALDGAIPIDEVPAFR